MRPFRRQLWLFLLALGFQANAAPEQWIRLTTPHFEMYTTAGEKRAREVILYFEEVRSFFVQASPVRGVTEFPVRIVAFRTPKQYEAYSPNAAAAAFYVPGRYRDYIVLGDMEPENLPVAIHEYMHLVVHHSGIKLPVWLNEGWADVYSTLKPMGKKSMVGDLSPGRVQTLLNNKWLTMEALTSVGHDSPAYNEKDRAGIFYAESWALVHMLYLDPDYGKTFSKFVLAIRSGSSMEDACRAAYGKPSAEVYKDLQSYLRRNRLYGALFEVKLTKSEEEAEIERPNEFESALMSADLLSAVGKADRAKAAYEALAAKNPERAEIPQSLGYLAWQKQDTDEARRQFAKAFAAGSKDAQLCFHFGMLELQTGDREKEAVPALRRALELKPDYKDARLELGMAELDAKDYAAAISDLNGMKTVEPDKAPRLFNGLAYAFTQTGNLAEARRQAELALKWDKSDSDKQQTESLIRYLDARAQEEKDREAFQKDQVANGSQPATAPGTFAAPLPGAPGNPFVAKGQKLLRAEGVAKNIECLAAGARITILSGGKLMTFDMPQPDRLVLKHKNDVTFDFTCGPQKAFAIAVEYVPVSQAGGKVTGEAKMLEF